MNFVNVSFKVHDKGQKCFSYGSNILCSRNKYENNKKKDSGRTIEVIAQYLL